MLSLLEVAGRLDRPRWSGDSKFMARCPAHEDRSPSLSVTSGDDGRILFHCHTGCTAESVVRALGLEWKDVLPEREEPTKPSGPPKETVWRITHGGKVYEHHRLDYTDGRRKKIWWVGAPVLSELPLYRSDIVSKQAGTVVICEGEKAADAAARLDLLAVGTYGAEVIPRVKGLEFTRGRKVVLWPDADAPDSKTGRIPGLEHMRAIAALLQGIAKSVHWIVVPGAPKGGDAADFRGTRDELRAFVQDAEPGEKTPLVMFADRVNSAMRKLDKLHVGDLSDFVSTGLEPLDRKLGGGFPRGQVTLIGAPTGSGKTALVIQFAMAAEAEGLVVVVSPEMSADQLVVRELGRRSGWNKNARYPWERESIREEAAAAHALAASSILSNPPRVAIYEDLAVSLDQIEASVRVAARKERIALIALDYAQQLAGEDPKMARYLAVGEVGLRAVSMAREFSCAVLVTSQVNTVRGEKGTIAGYSIRESANLEQKASNVLLFIVEREKDETHKIRRSWFNCTKQRDGALFTLDVHFDPRTLSVSAKPADVLEVRQWVKD